MVCEKCGEELADNGPLVRCYDDTILCLDCFSNGVSRLDTVIGGIDWKLLSTQIRCLENVERNAGSLRQNFYHVRITDAQLQAICGVANLLSSMVVAHKER